MDGNASKLPVDDVKTVGAYVVFISIGYSIASSSLSIINKVRKQNSCAPRHEASKKKYKKTS